MSQDLDSLLPLLRDESRRDAVANLICQRFLNQLLPLIRANLSDRVRQRVDEEDVLQSVWASFFRQDFEVENQDQLFALLATISIRKATDAARRHTAQKRDATAEGSSELVDLGRKPIPGSPLRVGPGDEYASSPQYEHESLLDEDTARLMAAGASPEHALVAFEIMDRMPEDLRAILVMRLQNMTEAEIAQQLGFTRRTITRRLGVIRKWMLAEVGR